jgi:tryptophan synthase alpha chain
LNRIDSKFAEMKNLGKPAFMPFITVGDPSLRATVDIIKTLEKAGANIVELGVPYSDPLADGPVIQRSSMRALGRSKISVLDCIEVARQARSEGCELAFVLFTYYNPVLRVGLEKLFGLLQENDISGIIIPDLPMEEDEETKAIAEKFGVHLIPLVAPTSNDRIRRIVSRASGFIYCVSSLGVTGARSDFHSGIDAFIATVKQATELPVAIGFGISTAEQVDRFSKTCDGIVVGSALVRVIEEAGPLLESEATYEQGLLQISNYVRQLLGQ